MCEHVLSVYECVRTCVSRKGVRVQAGIRGPGTGLAWALPGGPDSDGPHAQGPHAQARRRVRRHMTAEHHGSEKGRDAEWAGVGRVLSATAKLHGPGKSSYPCQLSAP